MEDTFRRPALLRDQRPVKSVGKRGICTVEYLVFAAAILCLIAFVWGQGMRNARKRKKRFLEGLKENYGKPAGRECSTERFAHLGGYCRAHPRPGQLDDITWNDLGMDEIFRRVNYTQSAAGEEYLYYTLRSPAQSGEELERLEERISYYRDHPGERIQAQEIFHELGGTGKFSLYDYLDYLEDLGERSNLRHILADAAFLPLIGLCFVNLSMGVAALAFLVAYNITTYYKEKGVIDPYITSFSFCIRLHRAAGRMLTKELPAREREILQKARGELAGLARGAGWLMSGGAGGGGNPLEILNDYLRMTFHLDIIVFNSMLHRLRGRKEWLDALAGTLGWLETAVCADYFRASLENGWCCPEFVSGRTLTLKEGYHPLLTDPVKNSIRAGKGVLITGSNASGKSTFLKTVALEAILAQTLHTCPADAYRAPFFRILSSMALKDDLAGGESYYMVEIRSLKRILDAAEGEVPALCFVDEVLRGTNTVERIAASTQILKSLAGGNLLCFAATHDIELTELLREDYENYHFEEEIREGDILFPYQIRKGRASSRNAIKLLELMGYDESIVRKAQERARRFMEDGVWRS